MPPDQMKQVADGLSLWQSIGMSIGTALAGLGIGRGTKKDGGNEDVVKAIKELGKSMADEQKATRLAIHNTAEKTGDRLFKLAEAQAVILDRERRR